MKRIIVTGGAGFIGSHLCERLLGDGHYVICVDNFTTGRNENIAHLVDNSNFRVCKYDVQHSFGFEGSIDQIYNLACPASPKAYQADPIKTMKTSVLGAIHVLNLAKRAKARVLQASTSEVYGDPEVHPQHERYVGSVNPIGIRACYDEGKRAAECLFMDYHRQYGVDIRIARIFNTYGPRMQPDDGRVVSTFIRQALEGENLTVFGTGNQTRSFCYVDDLVRGLILLMDHGSCDPINLGNDAEHSIFEISQRVLELIPDSKSLIVQVPLPSDDPKRRRPDLYRSWIRIGYMPRVPLMEGLKKTIEWTQPEQPTRPKPFPVIQGL